MRALIAAVAVLACTAQPAFASLYWQRGVRGPNPTVCFAGDAALRRPDRVTQIKEYLRDFEYSANIRFTFHDTCSNVPKDNGDDFFTEEIRVVIPGARDADGANLFDAISNVGKGCTRPAFVSTGSWSETPDEYELRRGCVFNLRLGDDNYADTRLGDPSGGSTPFVNHTLHEFGHALGLSHEHERFDAAPEWVLSFLDQIESVDATTARHLYDAGFRTTASVRDASLSRLQLIPGYGTPSAASALQQRAREATDRGVPQVGGGGTSYLTVYDRLSVMHYTWTEMMDYAPGNYANTGLSPLDRLGLHILYPEADRVAEIAGAVVVRAEQRVRLDVAWKLWGAAKQASKNVVWRIDGKKASTASFVIDVFDDPGEHELEVTYQDVLGRSYETNDLIRVLAPADYDARIAAPIAAALPLL
jgi:hypothetical protein